MRWKNADDQRRCPVKCSGWLRRMSLMLVLFAIGSQVSAAETTRTILIGVAKDAPAALQRAAADLARDADKIPLFSALIATQKASPATVVDSASFDNPKLYDRSAFNHLVVIGIAGADPMLVRVQGFQTRIDPKERTMWMEGFGKLRGDLGLIETERNPYLHSQRIDRADFDTCLIKLTGTSEAGVMQAIKDFRAGMLNGISAGKKPERPLKTLLDLDPFADPPPETPAILHGWHRAGWMQCAANEYRAFLDAGGTEPSRLWRIKYLPPGAMNGMGAKNWLAGPYRLAFGNAVVLAEFADPAAAKKVAESLGKGLKSQPLGKSESWQSGVATDEALKGDDAAPALVTARGRLVMLSSLDAQRTTELIEALRP